MVARAYAYGESLSRETTTTTDYSVVKAAVTFTPAASSTYALIWSVLLDNSTTNQTYARLQNTTDAVTMSETWTGTPVADASTSKHYFGGVAIYTSGTSPVSTTFQVQCKATAASTMGAQEGSLIAIKLEAGDQYNSSTAESTSTSTSWGSKVGLSWTPASAGDYLIIASGERRGTDGRCRLNVNGTGVSTANKTNYGFTSDQAPYCGMARLVNVSGAQTVDLEYSSSSTFATYIRNAYIVALRLDNFDARFWAEDRSSHSSTSSTYVTSASVTDTPAAVAHLIVAAGITSTGAASTADGTGQKITAGGSDLGTNFYSGRGYSGYWWSWMQPRVRTESASSTTWETKYARTVGTGSAVSDEHVLAVLQLDAAGDASEQDIPTLAQGAAGIAPTALLRAPLAEAPFSTVARLPALALQMSVPTATGTFSGGTPTVGAAQIGIPRATQQVTGAAPSLVGRVPVPTAAGTFTTQAPSLRLGYTAPVAPYAASAIQPTVGAFRLNVPTASQPYSSYTPALTVLVPVPTAPLTQSDQKPVLGEQAVTLTQTVQAYAPTVAVAGLQVPTATISLVGHSAEAGQQAPTLAWAASIYTPALGGSQIQAPTKSAAVSAYAPTVGSQRLAVPSLLQTVAGAAPSIGAINLNVPAVSATWIPHAPDVAAPPDVVPTAAYAASGHAPSVGPLAIQVPTAGAAGMTSDPSAALRLGVPAVAVGASVYAPMAAYLAQVGTRGIRVSLATPSALVTEPEYSFPPYAVRMPDTISVDPPPAAYTVRGFTIAIDEI